MDFLDIDTKPPKNTPGAQQVLAVGERLLAALDLGFRINDFSEYIAWTTEDFEYRVPMVGSMKGRDALLAYYKMAATNGTKLRFSAPIRTTVSDTTVIFEFESQGAIAAVPGYHNMVAFSFDIAGDKATGAREYWGIVDFDLIAEIRRKMN